MDSTIEILIRELSYDSLKKLSKAIREERKRRKNEIKVERFDSVTIIVSKHKASMDDLLFVQNICEIYGPCTFKLDHGKITIRYNDSRDCNDAYPNLCAKFSEKV